MQPHPNTLLMPTVPTPLSSPSCPGRAASRCALPGRPLQCTKCLCPHRVDAAPDPAFCPISTASASAEAAKRGCTGVPACGRPLVAVRGARRHSPAMPHPSSALWWLPVTLKGTSLNHQGRGSPPPTPLPHCGHLSPGCVAYRTGECLSALPSLSSGTFPQ